MAKNRIFDIKLKLYIEEGEEEEEKKYVDLVKQFSDMLGEIGEVVEVREEKRRMATLEEELMGDEEEEVKEQEEEE